MSLADQLAAAPTAARQTRKGPVAACDVYGPGDPAALRVIEARRENGEYWTQVQAAVDTLLGISKPIHNDKFRYHWTAKCAHWDGIDL